MEEARASRHLILIFLPCQAQSLCQPQCISQSPCGIFLQCLHLHHWVPAVKALPLPCKRLRTRGAVAKLLPLPCRPLRISQSHCEFFLHRWVPAVEVLPLPCTMGTVTRLLPLPCMQNSMMALMLTPLVIWRKVHPAPPLNPHSLSGTEPSSLS